MSEQRRADDMVDANGEPISEAHKAIYAHIGECKQELLDKHDAMIDTVTQRAINLHVDNMHHTSLIDLAKQTGRTPEQLMQAFVTSIDISERVVTALDGPTVKQIDGTVTRNKEDGLIFQVADMRADMKNGIKHKAVVTGPQWVFLGTLITALATIAVALIT